MTIFHFDDKYGKYELGVEAGPATITGKIGLWNNLGKKMTSIDVKTLENPKKDAKDAVDWNQLDKNIQQLEGSEQHSAKVIKNMVLKTAGLIKDHPGIFDKVKDDVPDFYVNEKALKNDKIMATKDGSDSIKSGKVLDFKFSDLTAKLRAMNFAKSDTNELYELVDGYNTIVSDLIAHNDFNQEWTDNVVQDVSRIINTVNSKSEEYKAIFFKFTMDFLDELGSAIISHSIEDTALDSDARDTWNKIHKALQNKGD